MKKYLFFLLLVLSVFIGFGQTSQKLDSLADSSFLPMVKGKVWMKIATAIVTDGKSHRDNYNCFDQTLFEIGSITKTLFSLLLAHAILENRVKPDDDIRKYLHGDFPNLSFKGHPIELIHLVNLTSSLPNNFPEGSDFMNELHKATLDTIPGLIPRHSNVAGALLGYLIENIYHQPYEAVVKKYILDPLNMHHTYFNVPDSQASFIAKGYNWKGTEMRPIPKDAAIAGGLKSSLTDMNSYLQYQLDEPDPAVKMTHQLAWGNIDNFAIGMNWFLNKSGDGKISYSKDGTTFGFTTCFLLYPEEKFGIVILSNEYDSISNGRLSATAHDIFNELYYTATERASDGFGFSKSINELLAGLQKKGVDHAENVYKEIKNSDPTFNLNEDEVNNLGYALLRKRKIAEALQIFKLNVKLYPNSWNVYDSYGETLLAAGQKDEAIKMYQQSIELNPNNENGKKVLEQIYQNKK